MHAKVERIRWRQSPWPSLAALSALAVAGLALLRMVDPRVPGNYPSCPFLFLTGCYCPGCGTLRALATLMEGDLRGAMGYNPLTVLSLPILAALTFSMVTGQTERLPRTGLRVPPLAAWSLLAVILAFWGLRNVPVEPFTVLAP